VSTTYEFKQLNGYARLPQRFVWLKILGRPGVDDFGMAKNHKLVVSKAALDVLQEFGLPDAKVSAYRRR
jgi:hypothetical protein